MGYIVRWRRHGARLLLPAKSIRKAPAFHVLRLPGTVHLGEHLETDEKGATCVGHLPVVRTYRCILAAATWPTVSQEASTNTGRWSMGIEYLGMKPELASRRGVVSTCSNHWTSSLLH